MKKLILNVSEDKQMFDVSNNNLIYIFENIYEYEEEILDMFEKNELSFVELENIVNSWGGKIKVLTMKQLINSYYKNLS
jgi:hypothetical protein